MAMNDLAKAKRLELIDMLQAESEGKEIESRVRYTEDAYWNRSDDVLSEIVDNWYRWEDGQLEFRLKPEPDRVSYCSKCGLLKKQEGLTPHNSVVCDGVISTFYKDDAISVT